MTINDARLLNVIGILLAVLMVPSALFQLIALVTLLGGLWISHQQNVPHREGRHEEVR